MSQVLRFSEYANPYGIFHRTASMLRFVPEQTARSLAMIDVDAAMYVECDDRTFQPLALIETAIDQGQDHKNATCTTALARMAGIPSACVLFELSDEPNPTFPGVRDIAGFRFRRTNPSPERDWRTMTPDEYVATIIRMREYGRRSIARRLNTRTA